MKKNEHFFKKSKRMSLEEISKAINISRTTLYKVINNKGYVSNDTKEKVLKALEKYNYVPNMNARDLAMNRRYRIGYVGMKHHSATYFSTMSLVGLSRAIEEFGDHGLELVIAETHVFKPQEQIEVIDRMLKDGLRSFIIVACDAKVIRKKVSQLREMGCDILYLSRYVDEDDYVYVGIDYYQSGVVAAEMMGKILPGGGKVQIMTNRSFIVDMYLKKRYEGFMDEIKKYKNIEILPVQQEINSEKQAYDFTSRTIEEHPDLSGIFDITYMIDSVAAALVDHKKQDRIRLIGFDLFERMKKYIKNSVIDVTVSQDLEGQAYLAAKLLFNHLCYDKEFEQKNYYSRLDLIVGSNLAYFEY